MKNTFANEIQSRINVIFMLSLNINIYKIPMNLYECVTQNPECLYYVSMLIHYHRTLTHLQLTTFLLWTHNLPE